MSDDTIPTGFRVSFRQILAAPLAAYDSAGKPVLQLWEPVYAARQTYYEQWKDSLGAKLSRRSRPGAGFDIVPNHAAKRRRNCPGCGQTFYSFYGTKLCSDACAAERSRKRDKDPEANAGYQREWRKRNAEALRLHRRMLWMINRLHRYPDNPPVSWSLAKMLREACGAKNAAHIAHWLQNPKATRPESKAAAALRDAVAKL